MEHLERVQVEIEKHSLYGGGWASGKSRRAGIETTCYALMALRDRPSLARDRGMDLLLRTPNSDGSWPAFEGDDPEGCWTTALAAIALRFTGAPFAPLERSVRWLLNNQGREGYWFWKWKFRTVDRAGQFNPDKYGWPWFPGTVSWVIPTAFSLIALKQSSSFGGTDPIVNRIQLGKEMLRDRACPQQVFEHRQFPVDRGRCHCTYEGLAPRAAIRAFIAFGWIRIVFALLFTYACFRRLGPGFDNSRLSESDDTRSRGFISI